MWVLWSTLNGFVVLAIFNEVKKDPPNNDDGNGVPRDERKRKLAHVVVECMHWRHFLYLWPHGHDLRIIMVKTHHTPGGSLDTFSGSTAMMWSMITLFWVLWRQELFTWTWPWVDLFHLFFIWSSNSVWDGEPITCPAAWLALFCSLLPCLAPGVCLLQDDLLLFMTLKKNLK